ncbi:protein LMBR1L-like [Rhopilema esculentum]|uniref:protein LMBR1L-like n=1 Tax=Rhopilema esculentum TaxID=499914 RepID=UPI0031D01937
MDWSEEEKHEKYFYEVVRQSTISLLVFICLYFTSYAIIRYLKKRRDSICDDEEDTVYRISIALCCFSMSISIGAVLLLPFSIISNEVLLRYPHSFYIKWLNDSLIQGLWNQIFLGTYIALFLAMPFAYFFTESEGLAGSQKGVKARVYETFVVLALLGVLVFSLAWVVYGIVFNKNDTENALNVDSWLPHLPFIYSCISLFGVLLQLLCTPLGFARLFSVLGQYLVKPQFLRDVDDEINAIELQKESLVRRLNHRADPSKRFYTGPFENGMNGTFSSRDTDPEAKKIFQLMEEQRELERERDASAWERNLLYPVSLLVLLALTAACMCMVALNSLSLLFMNGKLPFKTHYAALGKVSFSALGSFGSMIEIILIFFIMAASLVGFYGMPIFQHLRPKRKKTGITRLIANCIVFLVLSSALPILARTLGITKFDLMGEYAKLDWLGNYHVVLFYNLVFEASTSLCLTQKFTSTVRRALMEQMRQSAVFTRLKTLKQKSS